MSRVTEPVGIRCRLTQHAHPLEEHKQEPGEGSWIAAAAELGLGLGSQQRRRQSDLEGVPARAASVKLV